MMTPANNTLCAVNDVDLPASLQPGQRFESATWRVHLYMDSLQVTHIGNAGKRGKKCTELALVVSGSSDEILERQSTAALSLAASDASVEDMADMMGGLTTRSVTLHRRELRGVDVFVGRVEISGPALSVSANDRDFTIRCQIDRFNEPTMIPGTGDKKGTARVIGWARTHAVAIAAGMTFAEAGAALRAMGVRIHSYCAMD
jgi:hypothetical protein